ncbi:hypothetical protein N9H39_03625, partial [Gammaproteobacteria bacterium]|nr:hypothetical protein [Gammaproteobacteria bacterium]
HARSGYKSVMKNLDSDELVVPRFVKRFPEYGKNIIELRFRDSAVNELCRDYDDVVSALACEGSLKIDGNRSRDSFNDLLILKTELEREMLQRLSRVSSARPGK